MAQATLHDLNERLKLLWNSGRNIVVGWRYEKDLIWLCAAPMHQVLAEAGDNPRILRGSRLLGLKTFRDICKTLHTTPLKMRVGRRIGDIGDTIRPNQIDQLVRCYGAYETAHRGVGLFDIVGFTKLSPLDQMAELNLLESTLNLVQRQMLARKLPIDLARSTTGDGFYIWNRDKGLLQDICTYVLMILTLAEIKYMRDAKKIRQAPTLRACFDIGPHYSYHQMVGSGVVGFEYIVGDVTIKLARMMEKALADQILISDFVRPTDNDSVNALMFMYQSLEVKKALYNTRIENIKPTEIRSYLTGRSVNDDTFTVNQYVIKDKHDHEYTVFNAKSTIYHDRSKPIFLGLREADLGLFKADVQTLELGIGSLLGRMAS
jgi:hypothetical protein